METLGDEKVVSSLSWTGGAYKPCRRVPRKAFSCTHLQFRWPELQTQTATRYTRNSLNVICPANRIRKQPTISPQHHPKIYPHCLQQLKYPMWDFGWGIPNLPLGNTLILKSCCFGKLQKLSTSHYTLGNIRAKEFRLVKQHTLIQFLKHPESFICHWTSFFLKHQWFPS